MPLLKLDIQQGKTFQQTIRIETADITYKPITAITNTAPVKITAIGHGLKNGWRAAVVSVKGMTQINAAKTPPDESDYHLVTVVDADNVEFNSINAADYSTYTGGGYLQYNTPLDLTGYTVRMQIRDKIGGTVLASTETGDAPLNTIKATVDAAENKILIEIAATDTAAFTWTKGVYDVELVSPTGVVISPLSGEAVVKKEITI